jgi:DNA-binding transcriptional LysR family regulator
MRVRSGSSLLRQLSAPKGCELIVLKREPLVLAVPAAMKTPKGIDRDLALGAELPWTWIRRANTPEDHDQVASCCRAAGFTPQAQHYAQSINSQLVMVASGLGVAR